ncbi:hypothetical protein KAU11_07390, partial [Candidatus Babeliales bacterium]|nr:hypothetical protein [Candidatus Babeliales bacterium]
TMYIGGVSHYVDVQAWNYNTSTWIDLRSAVSDFEDIGTEEDYKKQNTRWAFPLNREDFVSGNKVRIRMVHNNVTCNSDHIVLVDETYIIDHFSSASAAYPIEFSVEAGDVLSLRYKADEDDVTLNILDLGLNIFKIGL